MLSTATEAKGLCMIKCQGQELIKHCSCLVHQISHSIKKGFALKAHNTQLMLDAVVLGVSAGLAPAGAVADDSALKVCFRRSVILCLRAAAK